MIGHGDARSHDVWLATGQTMDLERRAVEFDRERAERSAGKYGIDPKEMFPSTDPAPEATLNSLFATGRKVFAVDGYHQTIAFLLKGTRPVHMMSLALQEHGEKYLVMRMLANEVIKYGADGVIFISEVWSAPYDPNNPYRRAADAPEKKEFLSATLVTKTGDPVQLLALIERVGIDVTLGETNTVRNQAQIAFAPIYTAWGREIPKAWIDATKISARDGASGDDATTST
ncbi:MAG: hypothetical protein M3O74_11615 [Pseudomonadota bacterium]|nr:hypothetical protein [Pseudomonadota bacterium]